MTYVAPNYAPTTLPGEKRRRIWRNTNENPLGGRPSATFHEHEVIKELDGTESVVGSRVQTRQLDVPYADPSLEIDLRNPETDAVIAKISFAQIYAVIYSLGRYAQVTQDAKDAEEAARNDGYGG